jgi:hypothetical protein
MNDTIAIEIDHADLGIVRVALMNAISEATANRRALDGLMDDAVARIDHRIAVLMSALNQIADQECAASTTRTK